MLNKIVKITSARWLLSTTNTSLSKKVLNRSFSVGTIKYQQLTPIIKIDDLNKKEKTKEDFNRCKLASLYRLVDIYGWTLSIYNHITVRANDNPHNFYINPFGLLYSEITASSLLKIDEQCNVIEKGSTTYGLNKAGFTLHSAIHGARNDINAVIHVHTGVAAGISTLKCGLLPISQEALICGDVGYHDYEGILVDDKMRARIINDLGARRKILILRNHGVVFCGETIEEAWFWLSAFMTAASIQFHAMAASNGTENIIVPAPHVLQQVRRVIELGGVNEKSSDGIDWKIGEMDFEAEMRRLDLLGYNTGYNYKKPSIKN